MQTTRKGLYLLMIFESVDFKQFDVHLSPSPVRE